MTVGNTENPQGHAENAERCPERVLGEQAQAEFWRRVNNTDECWNWTGMTTAYGYGVFRGHHVHRLAMALTGADPSGRYVCHRCDNRLCCNPAHLFLGTARDNTQDCIAKGRFKGGKPPKPNFSESIISRVVELASNGVARSSIASTVGMSVRNVYVILAQRRSQRQRRKRGA